MLSVDLKKNCPKKIMAYLHTDTYTHIFTTWIHLLDKIFTEYINIPSPLNLQCAATRHLVT